MKQEVIQWTYEKSVAKVKPMFYKWCNATDEMVSELWLARENLSVEGKPKTGTDVPVRTWAQYCEDIGMEKRTANRWLERYDDKKQVLISEKEYKAKKEKQRKEKLAAMPEIKFKGSVEQKVESVVDAKIEQNTNLQEEKKPTEIPSVAPIGAVSNVHTAFVDFAHEGAEKTFKSNANSINLPVDKKGELPPDCFAISESLMRKLLEYQFESDTILKILLLVMVESYGQKPHSKFTKPLTEEYICKSIKYKKKDIKKQIKKILKSKFIEEIEKTDDGVIYAIKKDSQLWENIFKFSDVDNSEMQQVQSLYFEKARNKNIEKPQYGGKEVNLIRMTIREHGLEKTKEMLNRFFDENHGDYCGYALTGFRAAINKLQMEKGYVGGKRISKITGQEIKDVGF
jgi:hypothetical protein